MWLILQQEKAEDFVIATGVTTTVREFVRMAFGELGISVEFSGKAEAEKGVIIDVDIERVKELGLDPDKIKLGQTIVKVDPSYYRPTEVDLLIGDPSKANSKLGWIPKYNLEMLVNEMVLSDLKLMKREEYLKKGGFDILNYFE
jgi:GDPmannose 4,6-dehydratase